ncbi:MULTISPECIES: cysteine peptidase family C39 domain-containing protein [unclassified Bacillus (in: firmicutes)]|uniref:cysteine peptidase family C39 domain-containing protein n=1 Tax=Bacillus sp. AFS075034 TaxID=2034281 RepID=UPI000BF62A34|nr:hypothetical protein CN525_17420 [Bacillus sp. AFS014408]PFW60758.1 hypothetical protein COL20_20645 [Bacillus sp. AFS075034]
MSKLSILFKRCMSGKKVPVKLQVSQYDCGPNCLHMVLAYYGFEANFSRLKECFGGKRMRWNFHAEAEASCADLSHEDRD